MMQKIIIFVITFLMLSRSSHAQFSKAKLQATGLTCALCSNAINKAVKQLPFVDNVQSDIKNSAFDISFKNGENIVIDDIKKAVEDAGFSVGSLNITGNFENIAVEKDKHVQIGNNIFHFLSTDAQTLSGEKTITIVDKDFLSAKQFKKIAGASKMSCVQTGKAGGSCCSKDGIKEGARIYHVTI